MNIAVPPPRVLHLQARSVRMHRKPGGVTSALSISAFSHVSVTAMAHKFLFILDKLGFEDEILISYLNPYCVRIKGGYIT